MLDEAHRRPGTLVIGIDPVASAMADASRKAQSKRGHAPNALFVLASLEDLPAELDGLADRVTVNFPWGSLLRAVARPDIALLQKLARLCRRGCKLHVLVNMQPLRDTALAQRLGLENAAIANDVATLRKDYERTGFSLESVAGVGGALAYRTRWGSKLHHAKREILHLRAHVIVGP